jgi:hypothetical protein
VNTEEIHALKIIKPNAAIYAKKELYFFENCPKHQNIVEFIGAASGIYTKHKSGYKAMRQYFILENCTNGDIFRYVKSKG